MKSKRPKFFAISYVLAFCEFLWNKKWWRESQQGQTINTLKLLHNKNLRFKNTPLESPLVRRVAREYSVFPRTTYEKRIAFVNVNPCFTIGAREVK